MTKTKIEWADRVWNPVTGCTKISAGCKHCYAERVASRFWGERKFTDVQCHEDRLWQPRHWKKPSRVFVNSMSDLFHEDVPFEFVLEVWVSMWGAPQHTFQILTKRPERMEEFVNDYMPKRQAYVTERIPSLDEPLPNVWLITSVEDQASADLRIPYLLQTPATVRGVSCEPMVGSINLDAYLGFIPTKLWSVMTHEQGQEWLKERIWLDWVICGGESGAGARPMHPDWARSLRDQCIAAEVPFFFKQWGEWGWGEIHEDKKFSGGAYFDHPTGGKISISSAKYLGGKYRRIYNLVASRVGKKSAGRLLDCREWNEFPVNPP